MPAQGRSVGGASKALVGKQQKTPNRQNCAAPVPSCPPKLFLCGRRNSRREFLFRKAGGNCLFSSRHLKMIPEQLDR
jgi:hypothetical protein